MRLINAAIVLITLTASAHAVEQNVGVVFDPDTIGRWSHWPLCQSTLRQSKRHRCRAQDRHCIPSDNPAVLISAFRHQHGEGPVAISPALTRVAQEQANAMAVRDLLDHNALAPFSSRISRSRFNRAAENIAYGHADFASTLKQWTNSAGHRANLLLHGAKWVGVAHAQNGHRTYWAMVIGGEITAIQPVNSMAVRPAAHSP